jgi:hypothetical protein
VKKFKRQSNRKNTSLVRPSIIALAVTFYWASTHQPGLFNVGETCVWVLGTLCIGLLAYAIITVAIPASVILAAYARRMTQQIQRSNIDETSKG